MGLHADRAWRLDEQTVAMPAAHHGKRRFRRPQYAECGILWRGAAEGRCVALCLGALQTRNDDCRQPAKRWQAGRAALGDLLLVEGLAVAGDDRPNDGMIRCVGLQQCAAGAAGASGAAGHLAEELEGAFSGAEIAVGEAEVGIDHADQLEQREIVALGDELRADDDVDLAFCDRRQFEPQPVDAAGKVARHDDGACIRKAGSDFLGQALDAWADGDEALGIAAIRAGLRPLLRVAAVVAEQHAAETVLDQPGGAVRALKAMATGAAERQRRVAAAVRKSSACSFCARVSPIAVTSGGDRKRPRSGCSWRRSIASMSGSVAAA